MPGVLRTTAGWLDGKEVVEVLFDPAVTRYGELLAAARCVKDPSTVYVYRDEDLTVARKVVGDGAVRTAQLARPAKPADQKYYLRQTQYWYLPLTEVQAARLNGRLAPKAVALDPSVLLSPKQRQLLDRVRQAQRSKAKTAALDRLAPARDPADFARYTAALERALAR